MAKTLHTQFEPANTPDGFRDESLLRAAVRFNEHPGFPCCFPQDSLDYLADLADVLPQRGVVFLKSAPDFFNQLAIRLLPTEDAQRMNELLQTRLQKEKAVAESDFETAATLRSQQTEIESAISKLARHEITRDEITEALLRDGVRIDGSTRDVDEAT